MHQCRNLDKIISWGVSNAAKIPNYRAIRLEGQIDLPQDAYAILLLVNHDLFEDDDDEFVCGRAYGASRISVIATARYNPALDGIQEVEREHAWPASHCQSYIMKCIDASDSTKHPKKKSKVDSDLNVQDDQNATSPMRAALSAYVNTPPLTNSSPQDIITGTWLARVCRTSSHELGHCFGMDHCVYYACIMQGSGTVIEDVRQPPYLCPVDLSKLLKACGTTEEAQLEALLVFCERFPKVQLFMAFAAWIRAKRLIDGGA
ncbi:Archaemetzincin-2 [Psilocybe cubensis]|uniref:Archaemetzincin-2 n=2 Tax=Psilocybe cubensis TaxID=181762 RepID=A0ACB8HAE3_PSICU|nr:Archaemetzincin-2 [Psilocybe cubensis]KAH9484637.1 Archaemetzincin-2 [Psilocybe cubensis]